VGLNVTWNLSVGIIVIWAASLLGSNGNYDRVHGSLNDRRRDDENSTHSRKN
jgi:hypothetical protein